MNKNEVAEKRPNPRSKVGIVARKGLAKTAVVEVSRLTKHGRYGKYVRRTKSFFCHDTKNVCSVGDTVRIVEGRPVSKMKRWRVFEVVSKAL